MDAEQRKQFEQSLKLAKQRRDELLRKREETDKELAQQNKVVASLSEILGRGSSMDVGITEATTVVFSATTGKAFLPTEVRDELRDMGYDIDSFKNPLASLHQVLKRLIDKGVIEEAPKSQCPDGKKRYRYVTIGMRILRIGNGERS